jgi:adenosylcobinamide kinase/adenosylcobinamide-phosphate guanylyltransferase
MLKVLYFGGQKSGKTQISEKRAIELSKDNKPYYIATYNNSYGDIEMQNRISKHKKNRKDRFITIEESTDLIRHIKQNRTYLIDCISMWILNSIEKSEEELLSYIEELAKIDANIIFILNNLNEGVVPLDRESRKFVDLTGIIGQKLVSICDEVYEVKFGIRSKLK